MDKYTIRILALAALVCLHLVCSATVAQCRIMADTDSKKIDLPNGLCLEVAPEDCMNRAGCFHCLVTDVFYPTMDDCKSMCNTSSSLQDMLGAMTTSPPPPLPAP
ncbi:hypothetical protein CFC21_081357 [Triticum aestivum]|uniref:Uncharacterized protein n=2 Tax=Triticum aestivum TaxID=4565 RepID=A0A9R1L3W0_WHEAT|nr:hypothetical protein CFC21_081357 [Triticum aestivum]